MRVTWYICFSIAGLLVREVIDVDCTDDLYIVLQRCSIPCLSAVVLHLRWMKAPKSVSEISCPASQTGDGHQIPPKLIIYLVHLTTIQSSRFLGSRHPQTPPTSHSPADPTHPTTLRTTSKPADHHQPTMRDSKGWDGKLRVGQHATITNPEALEDSDHSDPDAPPVDEIEADEGTHALSSACGLPAGTNDAQTCWKTRTQTLKYASMPCRFCRARLTGC